MSLIDSASLIVTPNAYSEGKLYSVIPSDGSGDMSVTRATTATRVNSAGLVELVPYNLAQYSEQFDNAAWDKNDVTVTANTTTAPDGTLTADTINATAIDQRINQTVAVSANTQYTFSFYAKKETMVTPRYTVFDLSNGAFILTQVNYSSLVNTSTWSRITATFTTPSGCTSIGIYPINGASTGTIFLWGAQLVEGSTALPYQKTETRLNIPRLDYSNGTCPSLLVEPQRTNLATYSNDFSNAVWTKSQSTITSNYAVSPQGIQNASRWLSNSGATLHFLSQLYGFTLGVTYTISCYVKSNTSSNQDFRLGIDGGVTSSNLTATTEWQRFTFTANPTNAVGLTAFFIARPSTNAAVDLLIYGLQLEVGSYATSYIPTTSASVTRNADVISKTGISSLIGQTEGTLFLDFYYDLTSVINIASARFQLSNGTTDKWILISTPDAGTQSVRFYQNNNGSDLSLYSSTNLVLGRNKVAVGYKSGQYVMYLNGALVNSSTSSVVVPETSQIDFSGNVPNDPTVVKNEFNAVALWKTRLTNDQLASLTTL